MEKGSLFYATYLTNGVAYEIKFKKFYNVEKRERVKCFI